MRSILETGKDGYAPDRDFDERTEKALSGDEHLLFRDAVEILSFVEGDYPVAARVLSRLGYERAVSTALRPPDFVRPAEIGGAGRLAEPLVHARRGYRLVDLGCGYGRLAPLLAAFDCEEYLGVDRVGARLEYARRRYASSVCRFEPGDLLHPEIPGRFDAVWTSTVLQHFLIPEKLRLVVLMKALRAPGGVVLMREEEIVDCSRGDAERRYASPAHARHMVPIPFDELARAFRPLKLEHLGGLVYVASERASSDNHPLPGRR